MVRKQSGAKRKTKTARTVHSRQSLLEKIFRPTKLHVAIAGVVFGGLGAALLYLTYAATEPYTLYRLSNGTYSFYTISSQEVSNYSPYGWKTVSTRTYTNPKESVPTNVYKLYNSSNKSSWYYTTDYNQYVAMGKAGWTGYGVGFLAATSPTVPPGYCRDAWVRFKSPNNPLRYIYTASPTEQSSLIAAGWINEGIGFNLDYACASSPAPSPAPVVTTGTAAACDSTSLKKPDGTNWQCTFSDEFNATSLDSTKWVPQITATSGFATGVKGATFPRACFVNTPKNISLSGGYLSLSATQEAAPFVCRGASGGEFSTTYTSAQVMTYQKFSQTYGRYEVKAKLPSYAGKGLQETFWLWPNDQFKYGAWPASGEIDFGEFYSNYADLAVPYLHYHYNGYNTSTDRNIVTTMTPTYNKNFYNCKIAVGQFNTYVLTWQPGLLQIEVNGKPCVVDKYDSTVKTSANPYAPFDHPFFMALTQAIGTSGNELQPGVTPLPATTQLDYVRIWK